MHPDDVNFRSAMVVSRFGKPADVRNDFPLCSFLPVLLSESENLETAGCYRLCSVRAGANCRMVIRSGICPETLHADIWADRYGDGYQQCEALIGIAKGGWLGVGAGNGSLYKIFAHDSDIVFATICEEWGLLYAFTDGDADSHHADDRPHESAEKLLSCYDDRRRDSRISHADEPEYFRFMQSDSVYRGDTSVSLNRRQLYDGMRIPGRNAQSRTVSAVPA